MRTQLVLSVCLLVQNLANSINVARGRLSVPLDPERIRSSKVAIVHHKRKKSNNLDVLSCPGNRVCEDK